MFIIRATDDHYVESFKRLTESEILFSRVVFLYTDPALKDYAEDIASEVDVLPVGVCVCREVENPYDWIKKNLTTSSKVITWAPDVLLNPESVAKLGQIMMRTEVASYVDGKEVSRTLKSETVLREPVDQLIAIVDRNLLQISGNESLFFKGYNYSFVYKLKEGSLLQASFFCFFIRHSLISFCLSFFSSIFIYFSS